MSRRPMHLSLLLVFALLGGCGEQETSVSHYPTGSLWSVRRYAEARPNDPWVVWWPNARTRHTFPYRDGEREGQWLTYAETGLLVLERHYADDELHGAWKRFGPTGELIEEGAFERGRPVGVWRRWDDAGALVEEIDRGGRSAGDE